VKLKTDQRPEVKVTKGERLWKRNAFPDRIGAIRGKKKQFEANKLRKEQTKKGRYFINFGRRKNGAKTTEAKFRVKERERKFSNGR
jgi:hypothetical protein